MTFRMPVQTSEGVADPARFLGIRMELAILSSQLFMHLGAEPSLSRLTRRMNCHIVSEAYVRSFPDFGFVRKSGFFGTLEFSEDDEPISQFKHSWLVSVAAPGWIVDVSPFNGMLTPLIVYVERPPWKGIYREGDAAGALLDDGEEQMVRAISTLLTGIRRKMFPQ